ncbi:hypothetical protein ACFSJY_17285 [Thalassotalea euphylliae]|uniref:hypothetical protein n=1 Tax=Thalassotalea euphylliae TaxID=1655234 RepID=UPI00363D4800
MHVRHLLLTVWAFLASQSANAQQIIIADYIIFPPYQQADNGLTADFSALLTKKLTSVSFEYQRMTKSRLRVLIEQDVPLLIPFSQTYWFNPTTPFNVSQTTLREAVHVVSHKSRPITVEDVKQKNLMFLGRDGYNYKVIDDLVETERIKRYSCDSNDLCLTMLLAKRGDFLVMAKATYYQYLEQIPNLKGKLTISKRPLYFDHRAMLGLNITHADWVKINQFANELSLSAEWQTIKSKHNID